MKAKAGFVAALFLLIPWAAHAKEHGTVVDIWEQRDSYGNRFYIYQVETETLVYEFLFGRRPKFFMWAIPSPSWSICATDKCGRAPAGKRRNSFC